MPDEQTPAERTRVVAKSYDTVADEYVRRIADELTHKQFDRTLLDRFAKRVASHGRICDVGCGRSTWIGCWSFWRSSNSRKILKEKRDGYLLYTMRQRTP